MPVVVVASMALMAALRSRTWTEGSGVPEPVSDTVPAIAPTVGAMTGLAVAVCPFVTVTVVGGPWNPFENPLARSIV